MLKWTSKAESDLDEIRVYIAKNFDVDLAIKTVDNLIDQADALLSKNPLAGKLLESNPLFSVVVLDGNSIYYCENPADKDLYVVYVRARGTSIKDQRLSFSELP